MEATITQAGLDLCEASQIWPCENDRKCNKYNQCMPTEND